MPMAVSRRPIRMRMLMLAVVVPVPMFMFQCLVPVFVFMRFGQVQHDACQHQQPT